jgi:hypothetical protein
MCDRDILLHATEVHYNSNKNHQLDATVSPVFYFIFIYSSACFRHPTPIISSSKTAVAASGFTFGAW